MGQYAVIRLKGHQYRVKEKETLIVDKASADETPEVLLLVDDNKVDIGRPVCEKVKVKIVVQEDIKGEKLSVLKYKAKSRYRKKIGHRSKLSKILIEKISA